MDHVASRNVNVAVARRQQNRVEIRAPAPNRPSAMPQEAGAPGTRSAVAYDGLDQRTRPPKTMLRPMSMARVPAPRTRAWTVHWATWGSIAISVFFGGRGIGTT